jgi:hypothetical protein
MIIRSLRILCLLLSIWVVTCAPPAYRRPSRPFRGGGRGWGAGSMRGGGRGFRQGGGRGLIPFAPFVPRPGAEMGVYVPGPAGPNGPVGQFTPGPNQQAGQMRQEMQMLPSGQLVPFSGCSTTAECRFFPPQADNRVTCCYNPMAYECNILFGCRPRQG